MSALVKEELAARKEWRRLFYQTYTLCDSMQVAAQAASAHCPCGAPTKRFPMRLPMPGHLRTHTVAMMDGKLHGAAFNTTTGLTTWFVAK